MDSQASDYVSYAHTNPKCSVSTTDTNHIDFNSTNCNDYVFDMNDHTTLISDSASRKKKHNCQCSLLNANDSKSNSQNMLPWITFIHILCTAALVVLASYLATNVLIFEKESNGKEMDDMIWRSSSSDHIKLSTTPTLVSSTELPLKDKCEPLYVLVYAHCGVWFLFLILDNVARHIHHTTLRSRGHLRVYARLSRLASIPFQLVSLWTVLLAIFITIYAQQDEADMQPYCDANMLMSPKNGIGVLLVIEFICVTFTSLLYANSLRHFNFEKPPPDVCGWEENNYCDRWTPQMIQSNDISTNQPQNFRDFSNYDQRDERCLLDLLEYYTHANRELAANLGRASQKLHQIEVENESQHSSNQS